MVELGPDNFMQMHKSFMHVELRITRGWRRAHRFLIQLHIVLEVRKKSLRNSHRSVCFCAQSQKSLNIYSTAHWPQ